MDRMLIVEGEEDQKFFAAVFRSVGLPKIEIKYHPSGKQNAIVTFAARLELLTKATHARIGIVLDADDPAVSAGAGAKATIQSINGELTKRSFNALTVAKGTSGLIATANALPAVRVGAWVMPDNHSNGLLENFVSEVVSAPHAHCFAFAAGKAADVLGMKHGGPKYSFKPHHLAKAAAGTWLAWTDPPRMSLGAAVSAGVLDIEGANFQRLISWLETLYQ